MPKRSKTTIRRRTAGLLQGVRKRFKGKGTLKFNNVGYAPADIEAMLQDHLDALDAADAAKAAWTDKLTVARQKTRELSPFLLSLEQIIYTTYGDTAAVDLADFDKPVRTRQKPSVDAQLQAVELRRKTRVLRGTKGPRQKAKIKA